MTVLGLLARHASARARARSTRAAYGVAILGVLLAALLLALYRAGVGVPLPFAARLGGIPLLGTFILASVLAAIVGSGALLLRLSGPILLRPSALQVARDLDRHLGTDRHLAALEARGPLAPLIARLVVAASPPLSLQGRARRHPILLALAVLLLFAVALLPGAPSGSPGHAPVTGLPELGEGELSLRLFLSGEARDFAAGEAVPVELRGECDDATPELPVRFVIDGGEEIPTSEPLHLPARDRVLFDLRALLPALAVGEHEAVARAGAATSNPYRFRIEAPSPEPETIPPSPPPPEPQPDPQGAGPSPERKPKFVEPLIREGEMVEKNAKVPIEVPGGGVPKEQTLKEAWPELQRRKEAALNRMLLSPAARELVRRYFERLAPRPAPKEPE